jgi:protein gp37
MKYPYDRVWNPETQKAPRWENHEAVRVVMFTEKYGSDTLDWVHLNWMYRMMAMRPKNTFQVVIYNTSLAIRFFESASPDIVPYVPLPNVMLGAHVTTQAEADAKIPALLRMPNVMPWMLLEPSEKITVSEWLEVDTIVNHNGNGETEEKLVTPLRFIELRGSTGPDARPMHPDWARQIRDECAEAGVDFWFSGWGKWAPYGMGKGQSIGSKKRTVLDASGDAMINVGTVRSGRLLDGIEHNQQPKASKQ